MVLFKRMLLNQYEDKIRYRNISLSNYVYDVTFEKQFSALTFKLPTGEKVIAFEGTDNNLVGWEEDFAMIYKFPVPADKDAISYINENVSLFDKSVIVVGHSKGGHLAMTAAAFSHWYVKLKIKSVYNLDGPGFRYNEINSSNKMLRAAAYTYVASVLTTILQILRLIVMFSDRDNQSLLIYKIIKIC